MARWGLPITIPGVTVFNDADRDYVATLFEGWEDAPKPNAVLVANGGGPGAVASGDWGAAEAYYTLNGAVTKDLATQWATRAALLSALPATTETMITVGDIDGDKVAWVRRYDAPKFVCSDNVMEFSIPLVAPDPFKYGQAALSADMGVFSGANWYEGFINSSGWGEQFVSSSGWGEQFAKQGATGPLPTAVSLTGGTAPSRRLTYTITGPLTGGDWSLLQLSAGSQKMWVEVTIGSGQNLIIDCLNETATLAGEDFTDALFGTMHTLEPGSNTYQLTSATPNAVAHAAVSAYPAYE